MVKTINLNNINLITNLQDKIYKCKKQRKTYNQNIVKEILASEDDIKNGRVIPIEDVLNDLRKKYGF